jgi:hypothetical protein
MTTYRKRLVFSALAAAASLLGTESAARGQGPNLFCHQVHAISRPVSVSNVGMVNMFGSTQASILRTAHVCNPAVVAGIPSTMPNFEAATFQLTAGMPFIGGDYKIDNQFGPVFIEPLYADLLLTSAVVGGGTADPLPSVAAWGCYRLQYPAFPNFYVTIEDSFRPQKVIRIRKPRLLCVPTEMNGQAPPDPEAYLVCYRQVTKLPAPPHPTIPQLSVRTPFALEILNAVKDDLVCLPSTLQTAPPGSAGNN